MRKYLWFFCVVILFLGCKDEEVPTRIDLHREMRNLVIRISQYAKEQKPNFIVLPQNGVELVSSTHLPDGLPDEAYLAAIDAINKESLLYSYGNNPEKPKYAALDSATVNSSLAFLEIAKNAGKKVFSMDYCANNTAVDNVYSFTQSRGIVGFGITNGISLNRLPDYPVIIPNNNTDTITDISQVRNAVYVLTTVGEKEAGIKTKSDLIDAITKSNYDMLVTDLDLDQSGNITSDQIKLMRPKRDGGQRLILCYLSIGEAEEYRSYWQENNLDDDRPYWIPKGEGNWPDNYPVWYWKSGWHDVIYAGLNSQLNQIIAAGFDGVFLDKVDAFNDFDQ
jgi:cysteinyl-tRNA synthetase, unknown class